jgi:hypothetical protein
VQWRWFVLVAVYKPRCPKSAAGRQANAFILDISVVWSWEKLGIPYAVSGRRPTHRMVLLCSAVEQDQNLMVLGP